MTLANIVAARPRSRIGKRCCCLVYVRSAPFNLAPRNTLVMPGLDPGIHPSRNKFFQRGWITGSSPVMTISINMTAVAEAEPSQLPRIAERERRHPPGVFIQNQRPRDRRLGALAAVFAFAEPAVDADQRALCLLEVHPGGVDQPRRVADLAAESDRKTRLRLRVRRHRPAHHLR